MLHERVGQWRRILWKKLRAPTHFLPFSSEDGLECKRLNSLGSTCRRRGGVHGRVKDADAILAVV